MMLYGMKVVVARSTPRYTLPTEVMPGVPWPEGFREETNAWARRVCGETCIVPDDMMIVRGVNDTIYIFPDDMMIVRGVNDTIYISPRTYERVRASCIYHRQGEFQ
jgi:hypothetical protein